MKKFLSGLLVMFLSATLLTGVATGTMIRDSMTYTGPVTFLGTVNSSNNLNVTPPATGYLNILTGNLKVGNGTPTATLNGEDAYIEGTLEVDGAVRFDNASLILRGISYTLPAADGGASEFLSTNGSGVLSWSAGAGVTLDGAYDNGGAGAGRTINATDGAVIIQNTDADTTNILEINKSPSGAAAGSGIDITLGANATGAGITFTHGGTGTNDLLGTGGTWYIAKTGLGSFTGLSNTGAAANINASSNFATNLNTGTSTGAVTIGGGLGTVAVNSSSWDISTAGALSGFSSLSLSDDITIANGKAIKGSAISGETFSIQVYDNDTGPAYKDAILLTNGNTPSIVIGDGNPTIAINSADWDISATGAMTGIGAITMDGLLTGTLGATVTGATVNLNASSNFAVNVGSGTSTGTVTIGGTANQQIDVGNGAAVKTVNMGSSNTTSVTTLLSGSGGILLNKNNNQPTEIGTGTTTGAVTIGGAGAQTIAVGDGAAAKTVSLGSSNTTSTTTLLSGSGGLNLNVSNNQATNIGTGTTTGTVTIGGAGIQAIDIGNGAAAKTVALGSSNTTSTTTLLSGSGAVNVNVSNNQPVNINSGTSTGITTIGNALSFISVGGVISGASPLVFDGNTADASYTTLAIEDPTAGRTITLPDYTGGVPLAIAQGATQTSQAGSGTADVTGSALSMASGWFSAGKTLKYTITGTKTGANAAMTVHLYLLDAQVMSLAASDAAAGDWTATFIVHEYTDTAHQKITGILNVNGKVSVVDYAAGTKDMATGATAIKAQIQSANAGDTVTSEYVQIDHWVK